MRKIFAVSFVAVMVLLFAAGCAQKQQAYSGNPVYGQQGNPQPPQGQQAPIAGGCGVIAPNIVDNAVEQVVKDPAL